MRIIRGVATHTKPSCRYKREKMHLLIYCLSLSMFALVVLCTHIQPWQFAF